MWPLPTFMTCGVRGGTGGWCCQCGPTEAHPTQPQCAPAERMQEGEVPAGQGAHLRHECSEQQRSCWDLMRLSTLKILSSEKVFFTFAHFSHRTSRFGLASRSLSKLAVLTVFFHLPKRRLIALAKINLLKC